LKCGLPGYETAIKMLEGNSEARRLQDWAKVWPEHPSKAKQSRVGDVG